MEIVADFSERIARTGNVASFRFIPRTPFDFLAGQFVQVLFNEKERTDKNLNKFLSFSSGCGKPYFELTKKVSGSVFSCRLQELKPGDAVLFKGPMGHCVLMPEEKKIGFLTGGIGITPVLSILETIAGGKSSTDAVLIYSNWTEKDIAFKQEIDDFCGQNGNLRVHYLLDQCDENDRRYSKGFITRDFIRTRMADWEERLIYIFGPPAMVSAMAGFCGELGIKKERILAESFTGY